MSDHTYTPSEKILENYAKVLVHFALGKKEGIAKGDVVECLIPDVAKPMAKALQKEILQAGGHMLLRLIPTGLDKDFFTFASKEQLTFFPAQHLKSKADLINHSIGIIADTEPMELSTVDPAKIMLARDSKKQYRDWLIEKENHGKFTWTLALWGVQAKADLVGVSLQEYWDQIIHACFLDAADPLEEWRSVKKLQQKIRNTINKLKIEYLTVQGADVDLVVKLGPERVWKGGADRNIPSFELFTSPDWRGTTGWIKFNQPLYRYGNILDNVELHFENGVVTKHAAGRGKKVLEQMLQSPNANKIGEFSLTDNRLSRITHPMAETLYDENIGGPFGNTHLAIGMAYKDCYRGNPAIVKPEEWEAMGYNDSPEHTDIISTTDRTVTAHLTDGTKKVIYAAGQFKI
jgi:aminopeptidase